MLKIGLTGGIGSGKSSATEAFRNLGAGVIDADKIAREVLAPNSEGLKEVVNAFGDGLLNKKNSLDRQKLKAIVFAETKDGREALVKLESITHPKICAEINCQMEQLSSKQEYPYLIVDIPLLIEKNYQSLFDRIVVIDCLVDQQIERVMIRDELEETIIRKIIDQQASREQRHEAATDIVDNSQSKAELLSQVDALHKHFVSLSQQ